MINKKGSTKIKKLIFTEGEVCSSHCQICSYLLKDNSSVNACKTETSLYDHFSKILFCSMKGKLMKRIFLITCKNLIHLYSTVCTCIPHFYHINIRCSVCVDILTFWR